MIRRPPRSTLTDTLFPYTTLFRSTIAIAEIDEETGPIARAEIEKDFGVPVVFRRTDIGQEIDAKALVEEVYDQFGRIDILVNAAQGFTPLALIEDKTTAMFEYSYRTGLLGSLWTMQAAIPYMKTQADGRNINFCSLQGFDRSEEQTSELQSLM